MAANRQRLRGGGNEALIILAISGLDLKSGRQIDLEYPPGLKKRISTYISFEHMNGVAHGLVHISARQHGLFCFKAGQELRTYGALATVW